MVWLVPLLPPARLPRQSGAGDVAEAPGSPALVSLALTLCPATKPQATVQRKEFVSLSHRLLQNMSS